MLIQTQKLLLQALKEHFALGAFNVYNLEGALAVIKAAEELKSPVIVQILPSAIALGGTPLISMCLEAGKNALIPVAVHLDHCTSKKSISQALNAGVSSVMADGSILDLKNNIEFTKKVAEQAIQYSAGVEGELGFLNGSEDGLATKEFENKMTQPTEAAVFVEQTKICALAVCIGNVHGKYETRAVLDFERLAAIKKVVSIPLVLHGSSGLPDNLILKAINQGICKFNVNTEIRTTYTDTLNRLFHNDRTPELVEVIYESINAMTQSIKEKIMLFGSANKAV